MLTASAPAMIANMAGVPELVSSGSSVSGTTADTARPSPQAPAVAVARRPVGNSSAA